MTDIVFTIRLSEADWDDNMRGWRCPALAIPGAAVDALYIAGQRVDSARYEALMPHAIIRWVMGERPERATASIALTEALSLGRDTERWKKLAIVLPVVATILAAVVTAGVTNSCPLPRVVGPVDHRQSCDIRKRSNGCRQYDYSNPSNGWADQQYY